MDPTDPAAAIDALVDRLSSDTRFVHRHRDMARPAVFAAPRSEAECYLADPGCGDAAASGNGGARLWSHQAAALDHTARGRSVVITTPPSSGKSLCYQIPSLQAADRGATSLVIYPTKALAHDQLQSFTAMAPRGVVVAAYDGDCTPTERAAVRQHAHVVLTNPEMLHLGILANHHRWDRFLSHLELVVVDELHTMRGVFGSHVAHVLRRLRRLVRVRRDHEPSFVFTSATVGEPASLASAISGLEVETVTESGAPLGERTTVLWNPFNTSASADPDSSGPGQTSQGRTSAVSLNHETSMVAVEAILAGLQTLVFCRSRRASELVANTIRETLAQRGHGAGAERVRTYRAGYLAEERRVVELALADGSLDCVVATNALELGIDVAGLDAVVLSGFPGTLASLRQQCGRSGRGTRASLAVLVAGEDQLDQWMMRHPREVFRRPSEPAVINPANHHVLLPHVGCAADELPLSHADGRYWGEMLDEAVRELVLEDRLRVVPAAAGESGPCAVWSGRGAPAPAIGLRSASRGEYRIRRANGTPLGSVDAARVAQTVHVGAIYLHQGASWRVTELDHRRRWATVEPDDASTYTQVRSQSDISLLDVADSTSVGEIAVSLGRVLVTTQVVAYEERNAESHRFVRRVPLEMEPSVLDTTALWWAFEGALVNAAGIGATELPGALHAAEHTGIGILPLFALCDRWDLGGVSTPWLDETAAATVVIHDAHPGGTGVTALAFERAEAHLRSTLEVLQTCRCATGCPSCVHSPKCGNGNETLDKAAATALLSYALSAAARPAAGLNLPPVPSGVR